MNATVHDVTAAFPIGNRLPPSTMVCRSRLGRCTGKTSRRRNLKTLHPLHKVLNTFILPNNHRPEQLTIIDNHSDSRKNQYGHRKNKTNTRTCTNTGYHLYCIVLTYNVISKAISNLVSKFHTFIHLGNVAT
ncbi:unnamed protein product [Dicrocoelium dendriticum]|nr:unnamed protein product [Dicrocoelium dendriticum]